MKYRVVQKVFVTFNFLLYISYKTTFKKKYFKAISGQIFMKFISRHAEFVVIFVCMVFVFW